MAAAGTPAGEPPLFGLDSSTSVALLLTAMGSAGTTLGGLLVVCNPSPDFKMLGILQGCAGGLMLGISFLDLMPKAISSVGFVKANAWFYCGALLFALVVRFMPEPTALLVADSRPSGTRRDDSDRDPKALGKVLTSGLVTAIGIAVHNFPEGVAVYLASLKARAHVTRTRVHDTRHTRRPHASARHSPGPSRSTTSPRASPSPCPCFSPPEAAGRPFASRRCRAPRSRSARVLAAAYLLPGVFSPSFVEELLAGVAGIMAFLALHELLPLALEHGGRREAVASFFVGMLIMSGLLAMMGDGH